MSQLFETVAFKNHSSTFDAQSKNQGIPNLGKKVAHNYIDYFRSSLLHSNFLFYELSRNNFSVSSKQQSKVRREILVTQKIWMGIIPNLKRSWIILAPSHRTLSVEHSLKKHCIVYFRKKYPSITLYRIKDAEDLAFHIFTSIVNRSKCHNPTESFTDEQRFIYDKNEIQLGEDLNVVGYVSISGHISFFQFLSTWLRWQPNNW